MISYLPVTLVILGFAILVAALVPLHQLTALLPAGSIRNKWFFMYGLVLLFIAGYLGYIVILWGQPFKWYELIVSGTFLFGAMFVWLTINLSLQTAVDLRRIDLLETENDTDPLTRIYNRRYLDRRLDEEVARSKRYSLPLSVLMLDIDYFKRVNDTRGHQAGDVVLFTLAGLVKSTLREPDFVARYGGEEFLVICTNTGIDGAALVAEHLRKLVESFQINFPDDSGRNQTIHVCISIGVAGFDTSVDSKKSLIQAADEALYRAKAEGRNRVIVAKSKIRKSKK
ncbi:MAG: GGDEF domain-containing protein [Gallionella sp.]